MAPRRQSVKNKHAFSYGVCPFCNKDILEGEKTNIEHIFPFNQIKKAYGNNDKDTRYSLNFEKSISVLVHQNCNANDGGLEKAIGKILDKFQDTTVQNRQLGYKEIENVFKFGVKLIKFLPYIPTFRGKYNPIKLNVEYVRLFRTNLPLGIIVKSFDDGCSAVWISFNGVGFLYGYGADTSTHWSGSITIHKHEESFVCRCTGDTKDRIVKENQTLHCTKFQEYNMQIPHVEGALLCMMQKKDALCVSSLEKCHFGDEKIRSMLNLRALIKTGDINSRLLTAMKMQTELQNTQISNTEELLKNAYGSDISNKIKWLSHNSRFTFPDDIIDIVVNVNGELKIFHDGDFISTSHLRDNYIINTDVLLAGENLETLDDLSNCRVNGNVILDHNHLTLLDGAPEYVDGSFSCSKNDTLVSLHGAPRYVGGDFYCIDALLSSLDGSPQEVDGTFNCIGNKLISLKGTPKKIGRAFIFNADYLESLDGLPDAQCYVPAEGPLQGFENADDLHAWFEQYKKERRNKMIKEKMQNGIKSVRSRVVGITTDRRMNNNLTEEVSIIPGETIDFSF